MYINPVLLDDLNDLTASLDLAGANLPGLFQLLENATELAVPSLLGWKLTFTVQGRPLSLTSIHPRVDTGDVCASLDVPLSRLLSPTADGQVTLYAAEPGTFTMLAAHLATALHLPADQLCLDQDLEPDLTSGLTGLRELSAMNRAIGDLVERGHTMASAEEQVGRQSAVTDLSARRLRTPA